MGSLVKKAQPLIRCQPEVAAPVPGEIVNDGLLTNTFLVGQVRPSTYCFILVINLVNSPVFGTDPDNALVIFPNVGDGTG